MFLCLCFDLQPCLCVFSGCSPSEKLISRVGGQARSKTPNADMERSVYGADCTSTPTYLNKVTCRQNPLTCSQVITFFPTL